MGLDIWTQDGVRNFHIGYISFSNMRACFLISYGEKEIGDLSILINHSDCDGELSVEECKKIRPCLKVNENEIMGKSVVENERYYRRLIHQMYEFIEIIEYAIQNNTKLIFG